jgi:hypothetical protein
VVTQSVESASLLVVSFNIRNKKRRIYLNDLNNSFTNKRK